MPTLLRIGGLRVVIYPNDHRPSHVHVMGNGYEALFYLACPDGPVTLRENYGFSQKDLTRIVAALTLALQNLCESWREIHGQY